MRARSVQAGAERETGDAEDGGRVFRSEERECCCCEEGEGELCAC